MRLSRHLLAPVVVAGVLLVLPAATNAELRSAAPHTATATDASGRGAPLWSTDFNPGSFNQTVPNGGSASLSQSGSSLVCSVNTNNGNSKLTATAKSMPAEPTAIWAEYDVHLVSRSGGYLSGFYFEGVGGNHRHLHLDFGSNQVTLRDPSYNNEGPLVSVPGLNSGGTFHFAVIDESPHYVVYVNGSKIIDYTDTFAASTPSPIGFDCATGGGTGSHAITNLSVYNLDASCPSSWTCSDVGSPAVVGSEGLSGNTWTVRGGGSDIFGTSDQFHYVWQQRSGSGSVSARVTAQDNTSSWAKAGVMFRDTSAASGAYYYVFVTPGNGMNVQYRNADGASATHLVGAPQSLPQYIGAGVSGSAFTAYTSSDGATWTPVGGSSVSLGFTPSLAGLAVTSHNAGTAGNATMDSVNVGGPLGSGSSCPSGWTCSDIGSPPVAGSQSLSGSTWTVSASGSDIWGTSDQFRYVSQARSGDGAITARVASQSNTNSWAKSGVMFRASSDPAAAYYLVFLTPSNGANVQYRVSTGAAALQLATVARSAPAYVAATVSGTTFTAYTSNDGLAWTPIGGSTKSIAFTPALAGLAVTSHSTSAGTATFDSVAVSSCASGWSCADVGGPSYPGFQSFSGSTWQVSGGGSDIWGTADQFHYVYRGLSSDGGVSARVVSIGYTDTWAKSGVMLRASTAGNTMFYALFVTPGQGLSVQWRSASGGGAASINLSGAPPAYVKVARTGSSFTAYTSSDGNSWSPIGGSTVSISMGSAVLEGVAVTAHNAGEVCTSTFDSLVAS